MGTAVSPGDLLSVALLAMPWILLGFYAALLLHRPRPLEPALSVGPHVPFVSIVVPARNEARNIQACVESLAALEYPDFEIVVVDDRSEDDTAALVQTVAPGNAARVRLLVGDPLPHGWFGKPWACFQGARETEGHLLLFTDADTLHSPDLLAAAVRALDSDGANAVTLVGTQILRSFWERLVQPHFFFSLALRFRDPRWPLPPNRARDAIANGQYVLIRRSSYDRVGGHEAVRSEVVEDLRLAQILVAAGERLSVREAPGRLRTRMYTSLREIVEGWSKNTAKAARQTFGPILGRVALPLAVTIMIALWIAPPLILVGAVATGGSAVSILWSISVVAMSTVLWGAVSWVMGAPARYGLLYPLGATVVAAILVRSWLRGDRVLWKGRTYGAPSPHTPSPS